MTDHSPFALHLVFVLPDQLLPTTKGQYLLVTVYAEEEKRRSDHVGKFVFSNITLALA